jgi:crotonobetainyl-CoA:carnitine CoA-transferase CaiB-like acyl-CoA transferase
MSAPLEGIRVVEYAQYVAGPLCGLVLADLGADVVKVEPPSGDGYRHVMPIAPGLGRFFVPLNRGKRSVVLDLKTSEGLAGSRALVASADIVLHNFPPGRDVRFELGWEHLHARRPALVLGVVTSFGSDGPLAGTPAYDLVAQAHAGLLTAHSSAGDDVPARAGGIPIADLTAGFLLSSAVLAALVRARVTGDGSRVETSLLQAALAVQVQDLVWLPGEHPDAARAAGPADLAARASEIRLGLDTNPYYRCFRTADGYLAVACLNVAQRRALLGLFALDDPTVEAPDLIPEDEELLAVKRDVTARIVRRMAEEPLEAWVARLGAIGIPCSPVQARESVARDPQVVGNGLVQTFDQPGVGTTTTLRRLVGDGARGTAPALGADTDAVLNEVGL